EAYTRVKGATGEANGSSSIFVAGISSRIGNGFQRWPTCSPASAPSIVAKGTMRNDASPAVRGDRHRRPAGYAAPPLGGRRDPRDGKSHAKAAGAWGMAWRKSAAPSNFH